MTAPDRICIMPDGVHGGGWGVCAGKASVIRTEYIRLDLHTAAIAAAEARGLRMAADSLLECSVWCDSQERTDDGWRNGVTDARKHHMARILALIPAPPPADGGDMRNTTLWDAVAVIEERAREILRDPAMNNATGAARYDQAILCAELLRDMLPDDDGGDT